MYCRSLVSWGRRFFFEFELGSTELPKVVLTRKRTQTNFGIISALKKKSANTQECAAPHALSFGVLARRINAYDLPEIHSAEEPKSQPFPTAVHIIHLQNFDCSSNTALGEKKLIIHTKALHSTHSPSASLLGGSTSTICPKSTRRRSLNLNPSSYKMENAHMCNGICFGLCVFFSQTSVHLVVMRD